MGLPFQTQGRTVGKTGAGRAARSIEFKRSIEHPADVLARPYEADTRQFHSWILQLEDIDPERISRRVLVSLYAEFCDVFELRPMPWGRFLGAVTSIRGLQR